MQQVCVEDDMGVSAILAETENGGMEKFHWVTGHLAFVGEGKPESMCEIRVCVSLEHEWSVHEIDPALTVPSRHN